MKPASFSGSDRARRDRFIASALVFLVTVSSAGWFEAATADDARAEACSSTGLSPRILVTDDPSIVETQFCLAGSWTTVSREQYGFDHRVIWERVSDPVDSRLQLARAEAFFGVASKDPYAVVDDAQKLLDTAIKPAELVELRVALADARAQALKNRENTARADGCRTRARTYSQTSIHTAGGWDPPRSTGAAGEPSRITFQFGSSVTPSMQVVILNAIGQYAAAVSAQDAEGRYPTMIVPHDASDPNPATITFMAEPAGSPYIAETIPNSDPFLPGPRRVWRSGTVWLTPTYLTPALVGNQIGHVLGLHSVPGHQHGTMRNPELDFDPSAAWWNPHTDPTLPRSVAFDACMFLSPVEPVL